MHIASVAHFTYAFFLSLSLCEFALDVDNFHFVTLENLSPTTTMSQPQASFDLIEEIVDELPDSKQPSTSSKKSRSKVKLDQSGDAGPSTSRMNLYKLDRSDSSLSSSSSAGFVNLADSNPGTSATMEPSGDSAVIPSSARLSAQPVTTLTPTTSATSNIDLLVSLLPPAEVSEMPFDDPILIRGNGNITLFGLSNSFSNTFPNSLLGRVSREEFEYTINRINHLLQQQHSANAKFLILGCLCCCCSLGCSLLWPTFALSKRTRNSLEKVLSMENSRLYNKLGLNWRLSKQQCHNNHSFMEYILIIDFLPKMHIYQPD